MIEDSKNRDSTVLFAIHCTKKQNEVQICSVTKIAEMICSML